MPEKEYFVRKIAEPLISFFKNTNVSAEELTLFRILFGLFTAFILFFGVYIFSFLMVLTYQFILLLDYVDGSIAKYRGTFKINWVYLDLIMHIILSFLFLFAITISYYLKTHSLFFLLVGFMVCSFLLFNNIFNKKSALDMWKDAQKNPVKYKKRNFSSLMVFIKIEKSFGLFFILIMLNLYQILIITYAIIYFLASVNKFYSEFKSLKDEK